MYSKKYASFYTCHIRIFIPIGEKIFCLRAYFFLCAICTKNVQNV